MYSLEGALNMAPDRYFALTTDLTLNVAINRPIRSTVKLLTRHTLNCVSINLNTVFD